MDQPIGFVSKGQEDIVCHLKRSIYGLKQPSREWYLGSMKLLSLLAYYMVSEDHYVYVKKTTKGIIFLTLYVDDILLDGNNMEMIQTTKEWLSSILK